MNNEWIEDKFNDNSFDLLRYIAAFGVMFGHYTWMVNEFLYTPLVLLDRLKVVAKFFPGVVILFSISGFLISASYDRCGSRQEFLRKRFFRLYPELWGATLVNVIVLIILVYPMLDSSFIIWIFTQIPGIANTPNCLKAFATGSINGSLWTVFTMLQFYLVFAFTNSFFKGLSVWKWFLVLLIFTIINVVSDLSIFTSNRLIYKVIERSFTTYFIWFLIGVFSYYKRSLVIPLLRVITIPLIVLYFFIRIFSINAPGFYIDIHIGILCSLISIGVGYLLPKVRFKIDLSYQIFLYHWIVLNVMIHLNIINQLNWIVSITIFITITLILALLSYRFIGKKTSFYIMHNTNRF